MQQLETKARYKLYIYIYGRVYTLQPVRSAVELNLRARPKIGAKLKWWCAIKNCSRVWLVHSWVAEWDLQLFFWKSSRSLNQQLNRTYIHIYISHTRKRFLIAHHHFHLASIVSRAAGWAYLLISQVDKYKPGLRGSNK